MTPDAPPAQRSPGVGLWLAGAVIAMIVLQVFSSRVTPESRIPGAARGDMVLTQDALPETIGNWKQVSFEPAPPPEQLPKGQYWWVHQWQYADDKNSAIVSCDQLGEDEWHELTYCYRNLEWTIHDRTEYPGNDSDGGPYVVAELRRASGETAMLVFSVFFEDGTWAAPPTVNLTHVNEKHTPEFFEKVLQRTLPIVTSGAPTSDHARAIQCQVLVSNFHAEIKSELDSAIQLHLASRKYFQSKWLKHWTPKSTKLN